MSHLLNWGVHHKTASVDFRERLSFSDEDVSKVYPVLKEKGFEEAYVLSTCNRTEVYVLGEGKGEGDVRDVIAGIKKIPKEELEKVSFVHQGGNAVRHLFEVTSSLDSMVIGEPEIVHQVKMAFEKALSLKAPGKIIKQMVQRGLQVAKEVRTETELASRPTSVGAVAASLALKIFGQQGARGILTFGAGEMAEVCLRNLSGQVPGAKVVICNRSVEKARVLAEGFGGEWSGLDDLEERLVTSDIVICSLAVESHFFRQELIRNVIRRRGGRPLFVIDLGVPRNVDPDVRELDDVFLYDMDHLQVFADENLEKRKELIDDCQPYIEKGVAEFERWLKSLGNQNLIGEVMNRNRSLMDEEMLKSKKKLTHLSDEDWKEVEYLLDRTLKKVLHHPIHTLRNPEDFEDSKFSWRAFFFGR